MPLLALGLRVALAGRGYRYVQHLVFCAHFYCIQIACVLCYIGFVMKPLVLFCRAHAATAPLVPILANIWAQHLAAAPALILYLYFGMQRAYLLSPAESGWRAFALGVWACTVSRMFFDLAFVICLVWA